MSCPKEPRQAVVVAAVVERADQILVTERLAGTHLAGHWEFPGGKMEDGEDHRRCLEREMREELDVEVKVGSKLHETSFDYPDSNCRAALLPLRHHRRAETGPRTAGAVGVAGRAEDVAFSTSRSRAHPNNDGSLTGRSSFSLSRLTRYAATSFSLSRWERAGVRAGAERGRGPG